MPGGTESFNMVELTDKSAVSEENHIPVPEDKLKEEQKKEKISSKKNKRRNMKSWWKDSSVNASNHTASTDLAR